MMKKKPDAEEAHWRIDEHDRKLESMEKSLAPEVIHALINGVVLANSAQNKADLNEIIANQAKDIQTDTQVIEALKENTLVMRELIEELRKPVTRESIVNLPSGPVKMTVTESRN